MNDFRVIASLRQEIDELKETIRQLQDALFEIAKDPVLPVAFGLTGTEAKVLSLLYSRQAVSMEAAMAGVYSYRIAPPDSTAIRVYVLKLRKKLKPFGIKIITRYGLGYIMPPESKKIIADLLKQEGHLHEATADHHPGGDPSAEPGAAGMHQPAPAGA